jgi:cytochrome c oxidase subunit 2
VVIAFPSFKLLYMMDVTPKCDLTIKAIGNQWYWAYEYPDHNIHFDSNIVPDIQLKPGQLRLLEVDNRVIVPVNTNIRLITTSSDVLHSWAVPAFGVKRDSVPGRLNETWFHVKKEGVYYGQCSELCGVKHGFMPIVVEAVSKAKFDQWVASKKSGSQPPIKG